MEGVIPEEAFEDMVSYIEATQSEKRCETREDPDERLERV